jgi:ketosteroid isomerase-like protein
VVPKGDPVTEEFLRDFVDRWAAAWNSHDPDTVMSLMHPEIVWEDLVFWPRVIHGHEELREYVDAIFRVMPDVHFDEVQVFTAPADGRALFLFRQTCSAPARLGTDKTANTYGCDILLAFRDGKLSRYLAQYDLVQIMSQFDVLPPRGDRVGGAYLLSLLGATAR